MHIPRLLLVVNCAWIGVVVCLGAAINVYSDHGSISNTNSSIPLVSFQSDRTNLLTEQGKKATWSSAVGRPVIAEGVFIAAMKDYHDRLILDNTSIYLRFKEGDDGERDGTLVSVEGDWVCIEFGSDNPLVQGASQSRAYAIDVKKTTSLKKVQTLTVRQLPPTLR